MDDPDAVTQSIKSIARLFGITYEKVPAEVGLLRNSAYYLRISSGILVTRYPECDDSSMKRWHLYIVIPLPVLEAAVALKDRFTQYCELHELRLLKKEIYHSRTIGDPYLVTFELLEQDLLYCGFIDHFHFDVTYQF
jgi:hypothetical protein